jgi:hypothetical protein
MRKINTTVETFLSICYFESLFTDSRVNFTFFHRSRERERARERNMERNNKSTKINNGCVMISKAKKRGLKSALRADGAIFMPLVANCGL